ncbi:MAG: excinuclease ABC subunit UvrA [Coriobacteriia bacterium]|nr:excinuclease ABC subunit UvrA [Coriobacteriia bacterium]
MASKHEHIAPTHIEVHGARVHNLKNVDVALPLNEFIGIAGVSGSGKSSLALGVLYAEGSRRYMDALSTYTRRRISQAGRADVDEVLHVPAALALRQRPGIPGVRSTFGTSTELLNHLRLMFSRLGSHACPNGHHTPPSMAVALEQEITCPECGVHFYGPGAEAMAFNSEGACPACEGTGTARQVDVSTLVPDETKTIDEGAVVVWGSLMWSLMKDICREMGVRTDVPFNELTPEERDIVYHGPAEKKHILYYNEKTGTAGEMDFTYFNAIYTVENALSKVKDEKGLKRVARFLKEGPCPECGGTRLSAQVRSTLLCGINLAQATAMTLDELAVWAPGVPDACPPPMQAMARTIVNGMLEPMERLRQLGLGYLSLDRASSTLSTGERQRVQLSRAVRNRTTGVLYVLDEPSIGLHPSNVDGLLNVVDDLLADGNTVLVVDHDVRVLRQCDHLVEIGPASGADGGRIIAQGSVRDVEKSSASRIAPFLDGSQQVRCRQRTAAKHVFDQGAIHLSSNAIHTVKPLEARIPRGKLTAVTGVSGSGKTTLVLESLIPALQAAIAGEKLPAHVRSVDADGIARVNLIDASPIGINVRSTVATYSNVLDELRRAFAATAEAKAAGLKAGAFSYNTGSLRCPTCDGTGQVSLDVQFLPDVDIVCPDCRGSRYGEQAYTVRLAVPAGLAIGREGGVDALSLPEMMALTVDQMLVVTDGGSGSLKKAHAKLQTLHDLGLGYLTLGEATPALSGGEAQRLKLASEIGRSQEDALFVFDEPTIGLHPLDVEVLLNVLQTLVEAGATVVVIEHDLDMIANADWVIDLGPGGGEAGGRIVCAGTPEQVAACPDSITGGYIAQEL